MWRFWNCVPRFVRQQFHGPRASAGVCVEEEKSDHDVEKLILKENVQNQHDATHRLCGHSDNKASEGEGFGYSGRKYRRGQYSCRFRSRRRQSLQEADVKGKASHEQTSQRKGRECHGPFWSHFRGQDSASEYGGHQRWKQHHHEHSWFQLWSQRRSLEAVTWGAAMVFGLQLSRKPQLYNFFEVWKDPDKRQQWWNLLLRVAFSMPPNGGLSVKQSIVQGTLPQKQDTGGESAESTRKTQQNVPDTVVSDTEDKKTLSDVMKEFESSCHKYAAMASSVSGVLAAEQGQLTSAVEHLQLASRLGHAPAYFNLAVCHETGLGVEKDTEQAALYYRMAAEAGHAQSIFNLALMTLRGEGGIAKDRVKAMQLLNKAAKQGLAQAQTYLGVYYTEDDDDQQDFEQAASFFKAAASQNDAEAQYFLGICYENGWGVESSDEEAARLYSAAAELGHDGAMYNLAAFHEYGLGGIKQDEEEAMALYRRSAEHGNESAKFRLDEEEARKAVHQWSEQNSTTGSEQSQSPGLRRNPHSSSPSLTDYMRESIAGIWSGELSAWFSSQSLNSSSKVGDNQRPVFFLGDFDSVSALGVGDTETDRSLQDFPERVSVNPGCSAGMHRTSTMPELRLVSCQ